LSIEFSKLCPETRAIKAILWIGYEIKVLPYDISPTFDLCQAAVPILVMSARAICPNGRDVAIHHVLCISLIPTFMIRRWQARRHHLRPNRSTSASDVADMLRYILSCPCDACTSMRSASSDIIWFAVLVVGKLIEFMSFG
jgi:hypothetical protein